MAKKAKKKLHPMPKLGWKDMLLYWTAMILTGGGAIFSLFFPIFYRNEISSSNPDVIAALDGQGTLHFLWLVVWFAIVFLWILTEPYQHRYPVFGRSDIKYGPPAYPRVYPLLMKEKPKYWVSPKKVARNQKLLKTASCILLFTLIFSIAMYPRSLYGRFELLQDGSVVEYDPYNQQAEHYSIGEIESVCLDVKRSSGGKYTSGDWYARMAISFTDGERCAFSIRKFGDDWASALQTAQLLKDTYGSLFYIEDTDILWKVVRDWDMTFEESAMLYQLFETNP